MLFGDSDVDADVEEVDDSDETDEPDQDGDSDAAYEAYIDDQYAQLFSHSELTLREDATERIRSRILDISETFLALVTNELSKAELLLQANNPDLAAAFFHTYRSLDGYLAAVIINPISEVLMEPIAALFIDTKLRGHRRTIARILGKKLRDALLERICSDEESKNRLKEQIRAFDEISALRNQIVHGFKEPTRQQVEICRKLARSTADLIEEERRKARSAT